MSEYKTPMVGQEASNYGTLVTPEDQLQNPGRRQIIRGIVGAVLVTAATTACSYNPAGRGLHDLVNDYGLVVAIPGKDDETTMLYEVDTANEEAALKYLEHQRSAIEKIIDEGGMDSERQQRFLQKLYVEKDANSATYELYHAINMDPEAQKMATELEKLGIKPIAYTDWSTVIPLGIGVALSGALLGLWISGAFSSGGGGVGGTGAGAAGAGGG